MPHELSAERDPEVSIGNQFCFILQFCLLNLAALDIWFGLPLFISKVTVKVREYHFPRVSGAKHVLDFGVCFFLCCFVFSDFRVFVGLGNLTSFNKIFDINNLKGKFVLAYS